MEQPGQITGLEYTRLPAARSHAGWDSRHMRRAMRVTSLVRGDYRRVGITTCRRWAVESETAAASRSKLTPPGAAPLHHACY